MKAHRFALAAALFGLLLGVGRDVQAAAFTGLGNVGGPGSSSFPIDISSNGRVIVGGASTGVDIGAGFRWTRQTGMQLLSEPADQTPGPTAVSGNGRVIVGDFPSGWPIAHRWTALGGWQPLGDLSGGDNVSSAIDVSFNGNIVVGASRVEPRSEWSSGWQAFIWTPKLGIQGLGYVNPDDIESAALGVSRRGNYIVGTFTTATANTYSFRWSKRTGMQPLAGDPGNSQANAISDDGRVVVGVSISGLDYPYQAYRWTETEGMQGLGFLSVEGFLPTSSATGMSADGSIIVGYSHDGIAEHDYQAFVWDEHRGMRSVRDALVNEYGLGESLAGWELGQNVYISPDGHFLTGGARNPAGDLEAWRADLRATVIPEPGTLALAVFGIAIVVAVARRHCAQSRVSP